MYLLIFYIFFSSILIYVFIHFFFLVLLGDITEESISSIFVETAALAFRLNKPLSCRLLVMKNQKAGDMTEISNPYLCNTRVFKV